MPKKVEDEFCKNVVVALPEHLYNFLTDICYEMGISRNRFIRRWIESLYIEAESEEK